MAEPDYIPGLEPTADWLAAEPVPPEQTASLADWNKYQKSYDTWANQAVAKGYKSTLLEGSAKPIGTPPLEHEGMVYGEGHEPIPQSLINSIPGYDPLYKDSSKSEIYDDLVESQKNPNYHKYFTALGIKLPWDKPGPKPEHTGSDYIPTELTLETKPEKQPEYPQFNDPKYEEKYAAWNKYVTKSLAEAEKLTKTPPTELKSQPSAAQLIAANKAAVKESNLNPLGYPKYPGDPEWDKAGGGYYTYSGAPVSPGFTAPKEMWDAWEKANAKYKIWDAATKPTKSVAQSAIESLKTGEKSAKGSALATLMKEYTLELPQLKPATHVNKVQGALVTLHNQGNITSDKYDAWNKELTYLTNANKKGFISDTELHSKLNDLEEQFPKPQIAVPVAKEEWPPKGYGWIKGEPIPEGPGEFKGEGMSPLEKSYWSAKNADPDFIDKGNKWYADWIKANPGKELPSPHGFSIYKGMLAEGYVPPKPPPPPAPPPPLTHEQILDKQAADAPYIPQKNYVKKVVPTEGLSAKVPVFDDKGVVTGFKLQSTEKFTPEQRQMVDWWNNLSAEEQHAVRSWVHGSYAIKQVQQHGDKPDWLAGRVSSVYPEGYWNEIDRRVPHLESAMAKAPNIKGTFYRGMHSLNQENVDKFKNLLAVFENGANSSVSMEPTGADYFTHRWSTPTENNQSVTMKFLDTNGKALNPYDMREIPGTPGEKELHLLKGQRFNIESFTPHEHGQWHHGATFREIPKDTDIGDRRVIRFLEGVPGMLSLAPEADAIVALATWPEELHHAYGWFPKTGGLEPRPGQLNYAPISGRQPVKPGTAEEFQEGGQVKGKGNTDSVKAALTPGEFVVNKQATKDNLPLLMALNESGKNGLHSNIPPNWIFDQDPLEPGWTPGWAPLIDPLEPPPWEPQLAAKRNGRVYAQEGGLVPGGAADAYSTPGNVGDFNAEPIQSTQTTKSPATVEPTGGATNQGAGIYSPSKPNFTVYNPMGNTGLNDMMKFFKDIYANIHEPGRTPEPRHTTDTMPVQATDTEGTEATNIDGTLAATNPANNPTAGEHTDGFNKLAGTATTFGLQPNTVVNDDGTVDVKYLDPDDKGWGAFGYNTRDPKLVGSSLPVDVITATIGDYQHDPAIWSQIKNGDYRTAITNKRTGQTHVMNIVDSGPANWTGNLVDVTFGAQKLMDLSGKDPVDVQVIGPSGETIPIKGFHPGTVTRGVGEFRHGIGPRKEREAEEEEKPEETTTTTEETKPEETTEEKTAPVKTILDRYDALVKAGEKNPSKLFTEPELRKLLDVLHQRGAAVVPAGGEKIKSALLPAPGVEQGFETERPVGG
jgi:hypothetical protein